MRQLSIADVEFTASSVVDGDVAVEIAFNPLSDDLIGQSSESSAIGMNEVFGEEIALLRDACAAGFFGNGLQLAQLAAHPTPKEDAGVLLLQAVDLDSTGVTALLLMIDCVSQARLGLLEELGATRGELEQIARVALRAGSGGSIAAALAQLAKGPSVVGATFLDNKSVDREAFTAAEGEGRRLDIEFVFGEPLDDIALAAIQRAVAVWERLILASALNATESGRDWITDERDTTGGAEASRGESGSLYVFFENFAGSPSAAFWLLDAISRATGQSPRMYVNLVEDYDFDPALKLAELPFAG